VCDLNYLRGRDRKINFLLAVDQAKKVNEALSQKKQAGVIAHAFSPNYSGCAGWLSIVVQGQAKPKVLDPI
jgi:hypothetical protein